MATDEQAAERRRQAAEYREEAERLRKKVKWHVDRAGSGGSWRKAEQYDAEAVRCEQRARELEELAKPAPTLPISNRALRELIEAAQAQHDDTGQTLERDGKYCAGEDWVADEQARFDALGEALVFLRSAKPEWKGDGTCARCGGRVTEANCIADDGPAAMLCCTAEEYERRKGARS